MHRNQNEKKNFCTQRGKEPCDLIAKASPKAMNQTSSVLCLSPATQMVCDFVRREYSMVFSCAGS